MKTATPLTDSEINEISPYLWYGENNISKERVIELLTKHNNADHTVKYIFDENDDRILPKYAFHDSQENILKLVSDEISWARNNSINVVSPLSYLELIQLGLEDRKTRTFLEATYRRTFSDYFIRASTVSANLGLSILAHLVTRRLTKSKILPWALASGSFGIGMMSILEYSEKDIIELFNIDKKKIELLDKKLSKTGYNYNIELRKNIDAYYDDLVLGKESKTKLFKLINKHNENSDKKLYFNGTHIAVED